MYQIDWVNMLPRSTLSVNFDPNTKYEIDSDSKAKKKKKKKKKKTIKLILIQRHNKKKH